MSALELGVWLPTVGGFVVDGATVADEAGVLVETVDAAELAAFEVAEGATAKFVPASTVTVPGGREGSGLSAIAPDSL